MSATSTFLNLAKVEAGLSSELIDEVVLLHPELDTISAEPIDGTSLELTVRTDLPEVAFSLPGGGVGLSNSEYVTRLFQTGNLAQLIKVAKTILDNKSQAAAARYLRSEQLGFVQAVTKHACKQFWYGTTNDSLGFPGVIAQMGNTADHVTDVAGTLGARSSIFFVATGANKTEWILGNNRTIEFGDWDLQTVVDDTDSTKSLLAMISWLFFNPGCRVSNKQTVHRIKGLTAESGKKATWARMRAAKQTMWDNLGQIPTHIFMNGRSITQLREENVTPENPNPPEPKEFDGVPIIRTNSISLTETI